MLITDIDHAIGFTIDSLLCWLCFLLSLLENKIQKSYRVSKDKILTLKFSTYVSLMSAITFTSTACILFVQIDSFTGINNIMSLIAHVSSVTWNCAMLVLLIYFHRGKIPKKIKFFIFYLYLISIATLVTSFHLSSRKIFGDRDFIMHETGSVPGIVYIYVYSGTMLIVKCITIGVLIPILREDLQKITRYSLRLIVVGSYSLILFSIVRILETVLQYLYLQKEIFEALAFILLTFGSGLLIVGLSLSRYFFFTQYLSKLYLLYNTYKIILPLHEIVSTTYSRFSFSADSASNFYFPSVKMYSLKILDVIAEVDDIVLRKYSSRQSVEDKKLLHPANLAINIDKEYNLAIHSLVEASKVFKSKQEGKLDKKSACDSALEKYFHLYYEQAFDSIQNI